MGTVFLLYNGNVDKLKGGLHMKKLIAINLVLLAGFMLLPNIHIEEAVEVAAEVTQEEVVE